MKKPKKPPREKTITDLWISKQTLVETGLFKQAQPWVLGNFQTQHRNPIDGAVIHEHYYKFDPKTTFGTMVMVKGIDYKTSL